MTLLSERASRAHRARRLHGINPLSQREERVSSSMSPLPNLSRISEVPDAKLSGSSYMKSSTDQASNPCMIPHSPNPERRIPKMATPIKAIATSTLYISGQSSVSSRFTDADMEEEDVPMDELEQFRKSRDFSNASPVSLPSIHPPRVVSPNQDHLEGVSSVSSAEEPSSGRKKDGGRKHMQQGGTPPRVVGDSPSSFDFGSGPPRFLGPSSYMKSTAPPRYIQQSRSFDAPVTPPRDITYSISFDAVEVPPRNQVNTNAETSIDRQVEKRQMHPHRPIPASFDRLLTAIRTRSTRRPDNLSIEEKAIWDVVQSSLAGQQSEMLLKRRTLEKQLQECKFQIEKLKAHNISLEQDLDTTVDHLKLAKKQSKEIKKLEENDSDSSMETRIKELETQVGDLQQKYTAAVEASEASQQEHERAICAIQRVLADVNQQKQEEVKELLDQIKSLQAEKTTSDETLSTNSSDIADVVTLRARAQRAFQLEREMDDLKNSVMQVEEERDQLQEDLEKKSGIILVLEQELNVLKNSVQNAKEKESGYEEVISRQRKQLAQQAHKSFTAPGATTSEEVESLRKIIDEKNKSLENAKALIASLEVANGSMAVELRAKLKGKDKEVLILQSEAADRRRMMNSLATELKDLQTVKIGSMQSSFKMQENLTTLLKNLEKAVSDLQNATIVLESTSHDCTEAIDSITTILADAISAIKSMILTIENEGNGSYVDFQHRPVSPEIGDSRELSETVMKLEAKLKQTDAALKKAEGDLALFKVQSERVQMTKEQDEMRMQEEIRQLRIECKSHLEALEKKTQELQVLRDSLEVGDEVGYISGDESDEDEEADQLAACTTSTSQDAVVTLLARGGMDMADTINAAELDKARNELKKVDRERQRANQMLKAEKESLANAKMIISSLERANKTMLEDLRSRLHDSNTAIAALLDKSRSSEKTTTELKQEVERLREEKLKGEEAFKAEIEKLKEEALINALRLSAKENEINHLIQSREKTQ